MTSALADLQVFHGETTSALARVYARLPAAAHLADCKMVGHVSGPKCSIARTLAATVRFTSSAAGEGLLAEVVVPDPCFWSDELPMLYRVHVELRRGEETLAAAERWIGFRGIGARGNSLFREGKRWVPRGASVASVIEADRDNLEAWRSASAVMIRPPDEKILSAASEMGVYVIADLSQSADSLGELSKWPAVMMALLPAEALATSAHRHAVPNILIAERAGFTATESWQANPLADALIYVSPNLRVSNEFSTKPGHAKLPMILQRPLTAPASIQEARRACDALQRDTTQIADFAGYFT